MKKIITKNDLKKMNLTSAEMWWAVDAADSINKIQDYGCDSTRYFEWGTVVDENRTAYNKMVMYFVNKFMGDNYQVSLRACVAYLSEKVFFTSQYNMMPYLKGLACQPESTIYISDTFGLDCLSRK